MAYDHEEQEQIESLKHWWKQYGNLVTWLLILVLAGIAGVTAWKYYQRNQSTQAAQLFESLQDAVTTKDDKRIERATGDITKLFGRTSYASMANLIAAKTSASTNPKEAKTQLQWIIDNSKDKQFVALAKIRLAGLLLDEKSYSKALSALNGDIPSAYLALIADRRGDILAAQSNLHDARAAYQLALDKLNSEDPARQLILMKFVAIGGTPNKKPT